MIPIEGVYVLLGGLDKTLDVPVNALCVCVCVCVRVWYCVSDSLLRVIEKMAWHNMAASLLDKIRALQDDANNWKVVKETVRH